MLITRPAPRLAILLGCSVGLLVGPPPVRAQGADSPPAHVAFVEGAAALIGPEASDTLGSGTPIAFGDSLRTTTGRVEVLAEDGSALYVDEASSIAWQEPWRLRLTAGAVIVDVAPSPTGDAEPYEVVTRAGTIRLESSGEYRIAADRRDPDTARRDDFSEWVDGRRGAREASGVSRQHLPPAIQTYAANLDRSGDWESDARHGWVWYPTVASDWRPYYNGRWSWTARFGWTWIDEAAWGWPTHHYGRWGLSPSERWYWIPDPQWAPAWVTWAVAPDFIGWSAMGSDGRPSVAFPTRARYVDSGGPDSDVAWTAIPSRALGAPGSVAGAAVSSRQLVERDGVPFIQRRLAPRGPDASPGQPLAWLDVATRPWMTRGVAPVPSAREVTADAPPPGIPAGLWWGGGGWAPGYGHRRASSPRARKAEAPGRGPGRGGRDGASRDRQTASSAASPALPRASREPVGRGEAVPRPASRPSSAGWGPTDSTDSAASTGRPVGQVRWGRPVARD